MSFLVTPKQDVYLTAAIEQGAEDEARLSTKAESILAGSAEKYPTDLKDGDLLYAQDNYES